MLRQAQNDVKKLFGTDGIRGVANRHPMTPELALALGQAIAFYFSRKKGGGRIVVGKDTRRSSYMFEYALSAGISCMGSLAILTGPLPTPGIAFITRAMRADAGVVISASHNPFQDNGIKFFDPQGFKLPDEIEIQMEEFIFATHEENIRPTHDGMGRAIRVEDAVGRYAEFLKSTFPKNLTLKGLKIVIDCANGAGYSVGPLVLSEMDAEVVSIGVHPNGTNVNSHHGAMHPDVMAEIVKREKAHVGIALDGDADRVILCDERGEIMDGDQILALAAVDRQKEGKLAKETVVGTIMSNMGLEVFLREHGIRFVRTSVGDRSVMELMRRDGYTLGGEPSGHVIFMDQSTTGDGILAALQVISVMIKEGKPLSSLTGQMAVFPQRSKNIPIRKKQDLEGIPEVQKQIAAVEKELRGKGRVILRYSGTEPVLRLMIEGEDEAKLSQYLNRLSTVIEANV